MGSLSSLLVNPKDSYILGLWGADRYLRTSSIGLSNTNKVLVKRFSEFLLTRFPSHRLRLRIYGSDDSLEFSDFRKSYCKVSKNKLTAFHIYVNCRSLVREFLWSLENRNLLNKESLFSYFAGRFDGDGSVSTGTRKFFRIVYGNVDDVRKDLNLLKDYAVSLYRYKKANTYCLYFSEKTLENFIDKLKPYSLKLQ